MHCERRGGEGTYTTAHFKEIGFAIVAEVYANNDEKFSDAARAITFN